MSSMFLSSSTNLTWSLVFYFSASIKEGELLYEMSFCSFSLTFANYVICCSNCAILALSYTFSCSPLKKTASFSVIKASALLRSEITSWICCSFIKSSFLSIVTSVSLDGLMTIVDEIFWLSNTDPSRTVVS